MSTCVPVKEELDSLDDDDVVIVAAPSWNMLNTNLIQSIFSYCVRIGENNLDRVLAEFNRAIVDAASKAMSRTLLCDKIKQHLYFFHLYKAEAECNYVQMSNYYDLMEEIIAKYVILELEVARCLEKRDYGALTKKLKMIGLRICKVMQMIFDYKHEHCLHVLLKVNPDRPNGQIKDTLGIVYNHFLRRLPLPMKVTDELFCLHYLSMQKWKAFHLKEQIPHMDNFLMKRFKRSYAYIEENEVLRSILIPKYNNCNMEAAIFALQGKSASINSYFEHIKKVKHREKSRPVVYQSPYELCFNNNSNLVKTPSSPCKPKLDDFTKLSDVILRSYEESEDNLFEDNLEFSDDDVEMSTAKGPMYVIDIGDDAGDSDVEILGVQKIVSSTPQSRKKSPPKQLIDSFVDLEISNINSPPILGSGNTSQVTDSSNITLEEPVTVNNALVENHIPSEEPPKAVETSTETESEVQLEKEPTVEETVIVTEKVKRQDVASQVDITTAPELNNIEETNVIPETSTQSQDTITPPVDEEIEISTCAPDPVEIAKMNGNAEASNDATQYGPVGCPEGDQVIVVTVGESAAAEQQQSEMEANQEVTLALHTPSCMQEHCVENEVPPDIDTTEEAEEFESNPFECKDSDYDLSEYLQIPKSKAKKNVEGHQTTMIIDHVPEYQYVVDAAYQSDLDNEQFTMAQVETPMMLMTPSEEIFTQSMPDPKRMLNEASDDIDVSYNLTVGSETKVLASINMDNMFKKQKSNKQLRGHSKAEKTRRANSDKVVFTTRMEDCPDKLDYTDMQDSMHDVNMDDEIFNSNSNDFGMLDNVKNGALKIPDNINLSLNSVKRGQNTLPAHNTPKQQSNIRTDYIDVKIAKIEAISKPVEPVSVLKQKNSYEDRFPRPTPKANKRVKFSQVVEKREIESRDTSPPPAKKQCLFEPDQAIKITQLDEHGRYLLNNKEVVINLLKLTPDEIKSNYEKELEEKRLMFLHNTTKSCIRAKICIKNADGSPSKTPSLQHLSPVENYQKWNNKDESSDAGMGWILNLIRSYIESLDPDDKSKNDQYNYCDCENFPNSHYSFVVITKIPNSPGDVMSNIYGVEETPEEVEVPPYDALNLTVPTNVTIEEDARSEFSNSPKFFTEADKIENVLLSEELQDPQQLAVFQISNFYNSEANKTTERNEESIPSQIEVTDTPEIEIPSIGCTFTNNKHMPLKKRMSAINKNDELEAMDRRRKYEKIEAEMANIHKENSEALKKEEQNRPQLMMSIADICTNRFKTPAEKKVFEGLTQPNYFTSVDGKINYLILNNNETVPSNSQQIAYANQLQLQESQTAEIPNLYCTANLPLYQNDILMQEVPRDGYAQQSRWFYSIPSDSPQLAQSYNSIPGSHTQSQETFVHTNPIVQSAQTVYEASNSEPNVMNQRASRIIGQKCSKKRGTSRYHKSVPRTRNGHNKQNGSITSSQTNAYSKVYTSYRRGKGRGRPPRNATRRPNQSQDDFDRVKMLPSNEIS